MIQCDGLLRGKRMEWLGSFGSHILEPGVRHRQDMVGEGEPVNILNGEGRAKLGS